MNNKILLSIMVGLIITACNNSSRIDDAILINEKNTLRVDIGMEPPTFDPTLSEDAYAFRVINDLFSGLVDWDQSNKPIPGLASSWNISSDGKTYVFHLRKGLKFSDGSPITANDFVYSWQRLIDPKTASPYNFLLKSIVNADKIANGKLEPKSLGVLAIDDYTFEVKLAYPNNAFLSYITVPDTFVVPQHIIKKYGNDWTSPNNIVTSGAYTLKEHVVNGHILTEKNPYFYARERVQIDYVKYYPYMDVNVSLANFKTGALDTTWQNVPVDLYMRLKTKYSKELHTVQWERLEYLVFNMQNPKYASNLKLRKALSMAINRNILVNEVLKSGQIPLYSIVTPTIENGEYKDIKYSWSTLNNNKRIAQARLLYKEAGFNAKNPLRITLSYRNNDLYKKVALAIGAMWSDTLGIKVTVNAQEWKSLIQALHNGDYDIAFAGWGADYNSVTTYTPLYLCSSPNNYSHYCSTNYDNIINSANQMADITKQKISYKQGLGIMLNSYSTIPLYEPSHQRLVQQRVQNYEIQKNYLDNVQSKWMSISK